MRPTGPRDLYAGPEDGPEPPFPIQLRGPVIKGFGRGSRELGIPTANIPPSSLTAYPDLQSGVYFGFVGLRLDAATIQPADNSKLTLSASATTSAPTPSADITPPVSAATTSPTKPSNAEPEAPTTPTPKIYPSVLSIGYNPFYANKTRSIEIHILHHFRHWNFYHAPLNLLVMGFIRPESDYESLEALVSDIRVDCEVARRSLDRVGYVRMVEVGEDVGGGEWLRDFKWVENMDVEGEERGVLGGHGGKGEGKAEGEQEKL